MGFSSTSSSSSSNSATTNKARAIQLLESVYGNFDSQKFPQPLPASEAGLCANGQRRYLWTDAFAVLNFVTLAESSTEEDEKTMFWSCANQLADCVHDSLGKPRSNHPDDQMTPNTSTRTRSSTSSQGDDFPFVGLRIGKEETRRITDAGMSYDGMYWHYIDKWLLALLRLNRTEQAAHLAKTVFPYFYSSQGGGMRWKLSVDATPPPALQFQGPNDDTLTALITFELIQHYLDNNNNNNNNNNDLSLQPEITQLHQSLRGYHGRVTDDPLGWGLEVMYDQWRHDSQKRSHQLQRVSSSALQEYHLHLPFRLYGALLGATLNPNAVSSTTASNNDQITDLIEAGWKYEHRYMTTATKTNKHEPHSSINRVMLASVLLAPGALARRPGEPLIQL